MKKVYAVAGVGAFGSRISVGFENIKTVICGMIAAALTISIAIAAIPAVSRAKEIRNEELSDAAFCEMAEDYKDQVRDYLEKIGLDNAGITLTYISMHDGERTYTALIHHRRIDRISDSDKDKITKDLTALGSILEGCETEIILEGE